MRFAHCCIAAKFVYPTHALGLKTTCISREFRGDAVKAMGTVMALHVERTLIAKAGSVLAQTFVWTGLVASAVAAALYDIGHWIQAW